MYDLEKLQELLKTEEYKVVDDNGKVLPPSNKIYTRISEAMGGNPTAKHVYTIAKNNRNGIYDMILNSFGLLNSSMQYQDNFFNPNTLNVSEKFNLKFTKEDWMLIKPEASEDGQLNNIFQPGWTDIFAKNIWIQLRIPCPWTFKKTKILGQNTMYYKIKANCNECSAKLICILNEEPDKNEDVEFNCTIKNATPGYIHKKRRQLRGQRRTLVTNNLIDTKTNAITYIRNEAKDLINFEDPHIHLYYQRLPL